MSSGGVQLPVQGVKNNRGTVRAIDYKNARTLLKAAQEGKWTFASHKFSRQDMLTLLDEKESAVLDTAVGAGSRSGLFVRSLIEQDDQSSLISMIDEDGNSALMISAATGNKAAAYQIVNKGATLLFSKNKKDEFPVHCAAFHAQEDVLWYLIGETYKYRDSDVADGRTPLSGINGYKLLIACIKAGFLILAMCLVARFPDLAQIVGPEDKKTALEVLVSKKYPSDSREILHFLHDVPEFAKQLCDDYPAYSASQVLNSVKKIHKSAMVSSDQYSIQLELVGLLCDKMQSVNVSAAGKAIMAATVLDMGTIVEEILNTFPDAISYRDEDGGCVSLYHVAISNRSLGTLKILDNKAGDYKNILVNLRDTKRNNILHCAAVDSQSYLEFEDEGIHFQSELKWYQEIEKISHPWHHIETNIENLTPKMLFKKSHSEMKERAQGWYKRNASSCIIVAALILTLMFAAAITVPGGSKGYLVLAGYGAFKVFCVTNALSLVFSLIALFFFIMVLSSGYADVDFLGYLPTVTIIGMVSLILSLSCMLLAFASILHLVFGRNDRRLIVLSFLPALFIVGLFFIGNLPHAFKMVFPTKGHYTIRRNSQLTYHYNRN